MMRLLPCVVIVLAGAGCASHRCDPCEKYAQAKCAKYDSYADVNCYPCKARAKHKCEKCAPAKVVKFESRANCPRCESHAKVVKCAHPKRAKCPKCSTCTKCDFDRVTTVSYPAPVYHETTYQTTTPVQAAPVHYQRETIVEPDRTYLTAGRPASLDSMFVQDAAIANLAEMELGRLALRNASNPDVRNFGQRLIDHHQKAQSDLEGVARRMNLELPDTVDSRHAQTARQLAALSGSDFDRQFIDTMIREHRNAIATYESRAQSQPHNEVRNFAINTLPSLRQHLQEAQELQARPGG